METEGQDRKKISLPGKQLQLLKDAVMYGMGSLYHLFRQILLF